nr:FHA domain-containing protein [Anaerolineae bacterium]
AGNSVVLEYANVSPQHARIEYDGASYRIVDLNSTNGTFLGNVRLLPGVPEPWPPDKAVRIGDCWLRLERAPATGAQQATGAPPPTTAGAPRVAAFIEAPDLTVDPGGSVTLTVTVLNQGPVVDHLHVAVTNLPPGWLPTAAPVVRLLPGARQPVALVIAPPRRPESKAGAYPVTVRVSSQDAPGQFAEAQARLTVTPYAQFRSELRPQSLRAGRPGQVQVENQGNTPQTYTIRWQDRAEELAFEPAQWQLTVPEGQTETAQFRARPGKRSLVGGQTNRAFTADIASPAGEKQTLSGEVATRALIPSWLPPLLLVALMAGAALVFMLLMQGHKPPAIQTLYAQPADPVAGQPVTIYWTVDNGDTVELRPLLSGLDAASGQHTLQEGVPAGVQITFVATNQYGSTERPLSLAVREPTPEPAPTLTPTPEPGAPVITEWSVTPLTVYRGQPVTIRWAVEGAESVTIQPIGTVELSGTLQEKPGQTTRYILIASNKGKTVQRSFEVIVEEPPTNTPTHTPTPTRTPTITPTAFLIVPPIRITPPVPKLPVLTPSP